MRTLISLTLGMVAFLIFTAIEEWALGQATGWLGLFAFTGAFTWTLHGLQLTRRHH